MVVRSKSSRNRRCTWRVATGSSKTRGKKAVILVSFRPLSFLDALRPPMEEGGRADEVGTRLEGDAAGGLGVFERIDGGEAAVDQHGVGQRSHVFGRLELRRVGRQKEQMDMLGHAQLDAGVLAGAVEDQHDLLGRDSAHFGGERGEHGLKQRNVDGRGSGWATTQAMWTRSPCRRGIERIESSSVMADASCPAARSLAALRPVRLLQGQKYRDPATYTG